MRERKECQVILETMESPVRMGIQVPRERREKKVTQERRESREQRGSKEMRVLMEMTVRQERMVLKVIKVLQDQMDLPELMENRVHAVTMVRTEKMVNQEM